MKKLLAIILALIMIVSLTACKTNTPKSNATPNDAASNDAESSSKTTKDTMVLRIQSDPGTLDTSVSAITEAMELYSMIGNKLLATIPDENGNLVSTFDDDYSLAVGYEFDDDGLGMVWHLRDGVTFHNGDKFDANDVVYSINRHASNSRYFYIDFPSIEAVDDLTFHIRFLEPNANAITTIGNFQIVSKETVEKNPDDPLNFKNNFIGTGAYQLVSWVDGDSITLKAYDNYWAGKPAVDNIIFRVIPDASVAFMELETGGIDVVDVPSWSSVKAVMDGSYEGKVKYTTAEDLYILWFGFNCSPDSPLNDLTLRKAIAHAINREELAAGAYEGTFQLTYNIFSSAHEGVKSYADNWPVEYNVEKAKELMKEAGYEDGLTLSIINYGDQQDVLANEIIANQLKEIGITVKIKSYDTATWSDMMFNTTEGWDMWLRLFGSTGDFSQFVYQIIPLVCHPAADDAAWKEAEAIALEAAKIVDLEKRLPMLDEIQDKWFDEWLYFYPIAQKTQYVLYSDNLYGMERYGYNWFVLHSYFG